jgi:hypothetical protein
MRETTNGQAGALWGGSGMTVSGILATVGAWVQNPTAPARLAIWTGGALITLGAIVVVLALVSIYRHKRGAEQRGGAVAQDHSVAISGGITAGRDVHITPPATPPVSMDATQVAHFRSSYFCWRVPPVFFQEAPWRLHADERNLDELLEGPFCPSCGRYLRTIPPSTGPFTEWDRGEPLTDWSVRGSVMNPCVCGWAFGNDDLSSMNLYALKSIVYREAQQLLHTTGISAFNGGPCRDNRAPKNPDPPRSETASPWRR